MLVRARAGSQCNAYAVITAFSYCSHVHFADSDSGPSQRNRKGLPCIRTSPHLSFPPARLAPRYHGVSWGP